MLAARNKHPDRDKFDSILQLSHEQIEAIDSGDFERFQSILTRKGELIGSMQNTQSVIDTDPTVKGVIEQIKASEHDAEALLRTRLEGVKRQLTDLRQFQTAGSQYRRATRKTPKFATEPNTPMLFDYRS